MTEMPIMSVSGIRGVVGKSIDEMFVAKIACIQTISAGGGKIIVGRDTRLSGENLARAAFRGIRAAGGTPVDIGIAPTPTACVAVAVLKASGGIIITASHNPGQYNGYKMVHHTGRLYRAEECERVYESFRASEGSLKDRLKSVPDSPVERVDAAEIHLTRILPHVDIASIRAAHIKVAVDSINGAAGTIFPKLLEKLSVEWIGVNNKLDGNFVHNPEPRPEHLTGLAALLRNNPGMWGGFVFDPDADRLATMGEHGEEISEEMTLVFALENILEKIKTPVATNLSTSMLVDDVAKRFGVAVVRTRIGEANVVEGMEKNHCLAGGEGNGGVIYPAISTVRDGIAGMALIIELMAKRGMPLSELAAKWPAYAIVKDKIPCENRDPKRIIAELTTMFASEKVDLQDGLKIIRDYGWVHLRPSNTEPIIRCYAEAQTEKQAKELSEMVMNEVQRL